MPVKKLAPLLSLALLLVSCTSGGKRLNCEGVQLLLAEDTVSLEFTDRLLVLGPFEIKGSIIEYADMGPGDDDERFVTYQMLRLDLESGLLTYVRHRPDFEYIQATCKRH